MSEIQVYPENAIKKHRSEVDLVNNGILPNIPAMFQGRVASSPDKTAYCEYDASQNKWVDYSWKQMADRVHKWRLAILSEGFADGARAAIRLHNGTNWVCFDQAVLASNMVVVPLYAEDRADNINYILQDTQAELLLLETLEQWQELEKEDEKEQEQGQGQKKDQKQGQKQSQGSQDLSSLKRIVIIESFDQEVADSRVIHLQKWLDDAPQETLPEHDIPATALATIVYTSGTTGKPKGVKLSHRNILDNAFAGLKSVVIYPQDRFLSFLPLSHMFERTVGYYLTMMAGAKVTYNRSIPQLLEDLSIVKPTAMIGVPRIFEKAHKSIMSKLDDASFIKKALFQKAVDIGWHRFRVRQKRAKWQVKQIFWPVLDKLVATKVRERFGGELRLVVVGGAPLSKNVAQLFIGLGIEILQGYGMTENSPVATVNTLERNKPESIGLALHGMHLKLGDKDELMIKSSSVMLGYWNNEQATKETITDDGWLHTGDVASIDDEGFISITGRIKEIIVLSNGEKLPPADMEMAICEDNMFDQAMVVGENRPYMTALLVLNQDDWENFAKRHDLPTNLQEAIDDEKTKEMAKKRVTQRIESFPGYAFIKQITLLAQDWTVEDGELTPTLKLKRPVLLEQFEEEIKSMYAEKNE